MKRVNYCLVITPNFNDLKTNAHQNGIQKLISYRVCYGVRNERLHKRYMALWKIMGVYGNKMPTRCNRWFLLHILLLAQHVSGTIMPIIRSSRVLYKWLLPVVFSAVKMEIVICRLGRFCVFGIKCRWHFTSTY